MTRSYQYSQFNGEDIIKSDEPDACQTINDETEFVSELFINSLNQ